MTLTDPRTAAKKRGYDLGGLSGGVSVGHPFGQVFTQSRASTVHIDILCTPIAQRMDDNIKDL